VSTNLQDKEAHKVAAYIDACAKVIAARPEPSAALVADLLRMLADSIREGAHRSP
jgi:hypothetical protein